MRRNIEGRATAEISLSNAAENFARVRQRTGAKLCCVIKANAYGHGATVLGHLYQELGADFLAVATPEEAMRLRMRGIRCPVLLLGYALPAFAEEAVRQNIVLTVYDRTQAEALAACGCGRHGGIPVHLKLDTGMGRLGFRPRSDAEDLLAVCRLSGLRITGVYTHFANADTGEGGSAATREQIRLFLIGAELVQDAVGHPLLKHAANSGGLLDYPEAHFDMVRAGIVLYGILPGTVSHPIPLSPVMTLRAPVISVKEVPAGTPLGYGGAYVTSRTTRVGIVPLGYADGLPRRAGEAGCLFRVGNGYAPIVGRVCMDQALLDLTDTEARMGDDAFLFGDDPKVSAAACARSLGTIPYELLTGIGERVRRVYR